MERLRRAAAALLVGLVVLLGGWWGVQPAAWAAGDTFDRFDVAYVVDADGVLRVTETIVLRFGSSSGRHGLERYLVTREPFDDDQDMRFDISGVTVTSPDGVPTTLSQSSYDTSPRDGVLRLRIGDPTTTISRPTATYVLSYAVRGSLRTPADYAELYWDVTGSSMGTIASSRVTAQVPGGALDVQCSAAPPGQSRPCATSSVVDGVATFVQAPIPQGSLLTIGVKIDRAAVRNATPLLQERGDLAEVRVTRIWQGAGAAGALAIPLVAWWFYRNRLRDERYGGLPPGTVPVRGQSAAIVPDKGIEIPVSFVPPKLPLTYAGYLLEGGYATPHLTATLVGAAVAGAIRLDSSGKPRAELLHQGRAPDEPTSLLVSHLFRRGRAVDFGGPGHLLDASRALEADAEATARQNGWFRQARTGRRTGSALGFLWVLFLVPTFLEVGSLFTGGMPWFLVPVTLSALATGGYVRARTARGQRTAQGRAWTDQVQGFRTYLATAEADQLRFEEGEDIFSKYLPWAILFGLADRWVRICRQAIAAGLLAEPDASWYGGTTWNPNLILWNLDTWNHEVGTSAAPVPSAGPSFSSDTGFGGGGSSFGGGGGFSGGGGGGGGAGSW